jgi:hypothetical protein
MDQNSNQNIQPATQTTSVTVVSFKVELTNLIFSTSAKFRVMTYDENNYFVSAVEVVMEGEDYAMWSNDDEYVYQFVADKLGFILV